MPALILLPLPRCPQVVSWTRWWNSREPPPVCHCHCRLCIPPSCCSPARLASGWGWLPLQKLPFQQLRPPCLQLCSDRCPNRHIVINMILTASRILVSGNPMGISLRCVQFFAKERPVCLSPVAILPQALLVWFRPFARLAGELQWRHRHRCTAPLPPLLPPKPPSLLECGSSDGVRADRLAPGRHQSAQPSKALGAQRPLPLSSPSRRPPVRPLASPPRRLRCRALFFEEGSAEPKFQGQAHPFPLFLLLFPLLLPCLFQGDATPPPPLSSPLLLFLFSMNGGIGTFSLWEIGHGLCWMLIILLALPLPARLQVWTRRWFHGPIRLLLCLLQVATLPPPLRLHLRLLPPAWLASVQLLRAVLGGFRTGARPEVCLSYRIPTPHRFLLVRRATPRSGTPWSRTTLVCLPPPLPPLSPLICLLLHPLFRLGASPRPIIPRVIMLPTLLQKPLAEMSLN